MDLPSLEIPGEGLGVRGEAGSRQIAVGGGGGSAMIIVIIIEFEPLQRGLACPGRRWMPAGVECWIGFPSALLPERSWLADQLPAPAVRAFFVSFFYSNDSVFLSCNLTAENRA